MSNARQEQSMLQVMSARAEHVVGRVTETFKRFDLNFRLKPRCSLDRGEVRESHGGENVDGKHELDVLKTISPWAGKNAGSTQNTGKCNRRVTAWKRIWESLQCQVFEQWNSILRQ